MRGDIAEDDAYFADLRAHYSRGILELFKRLPDPDWLATGQAAAD
jgi:predicted proteasome-type protease